MWQEATYPLNPRLSPLWGSLVSGLLRESRSSFSSEFLLLLTLLLVSSLLLFEGTEQFLLAIVFKVILVSNYTVSVLCPACYITMLTCSFKRHKCYMWR